MRKCRPVFLQLRFCVIPTCMIMGCVSLDFLAQTIPLYCLLAHVSTMYLNVSKIRIHRCKVAINAAAVSPSVHRVPRMSPSKNRMCPAKGASIYRRGVISSLVLWSACKCVYHACYSVIELVWRSVTSDFAPRLLHEAHESPPLAKRIGGICFLSHAQPSCSRCICNLVQDNRRKSYRK